jgi:hypothetical protein
MADNQKRDGGKIEPKRRILLTEPAPPPPMKKGTQRLPAFDGLDNSDLRTLMALAMKKANEGK